jgi:hypothetical protein
MPLTVPTAMLDRGSSQTATVPVLTTAATMLSTITVIVAVTATADN